MEETVWYHLGFSGCECGVSPPYLHCPTWAEPGWADRGCFALLLLAL